jgi:hypothetical protein
MSIALFGGNIMDLKKIDVKLFCLEKGYLYFNPSIQIQIKYARTLRGLAYCGKEVISNLAGEIKYLYHNKGKIFKNAVRAITVSS